MLLAEILQTSADPPIRAKEEAEKDQMVPFMTCIQEITASQGE
jgi:hypothetical protein